MNQPSYAASAAAARSSTSAAVAGVGAMEVSEITKKAEAQRGGEGGGHKDSPERERAARRSRVRAADRGGSGALEGAVRECGVGF